MSSYALRKGPFAKKDKKNPPILSHEFVIQNHADIVSCIAMVFVVGLMLQATNAIASIFIVMGHNVTGNDANADNPRGVPFLYESGWRDFPAVIFYSMIAIIIHAIIQEYLLDKISRKLHLSKFKLSRFNESGQLVIFYLASFLWGAEIILREKYAENMPKLWLNYPEHPMTFLHKLYFVFQMAYYIHILPELYFQKVKKEEFPAKIMQSVGGFLVISFVYFLSFRRIAIVLLTLHYFSAFISHTFALVEIFDKDEKYAKFGVFNNLIFGITSFSTLVLSFLTFFSGIGKIDSSRGMMGLVVAFIIQGFLIFRFIATTLKLKRESKEQATNTKKTKVVNTGKSKKDRQKESDLPEADQNNTVSSKKLKSK